MQSTRKRVTALLLSFVMALSLLPAMTGTASAADTDNAASWPTGSNAVTINTSAIQKQENCTKEEAFEKAYAKLQNALADSNVRYIRLEDNISNDENDPIATRKVLTVSGEKHLDLNGYEIEIWLWLDSEHAGSTKQHTHPAVTLLTVTEGADLTIYDTSSKGTGRIQTNSRLDQLESCETPHPSRHVIKVESGGKLTVNGGTIEAGRTIKFWSYWYSHYMRQYVRGSAVIAAAGSTVVINGGKFISRMASAVDIYSAKSTTTDVEINDGEFLGNAGASCIELPKDQDNVQLLVRGGKFTCDKNDYVYAGQYSDGTYANYKDSYGETFENTDVRKVMHPGSRITKEVTKNDSGRPEVVVQPRTGTNNEVVTIKNPGFSVWYTHNANARCVQLDTQNYQPLYGDAGGAPNSDYNSKTYYYDAVAAWQFVDSNGKAISNMVVKDWDEPVALSEFKKLDESTLYAWLKPNEYKTLTCTVYESWKMHNTYSIENSASYQIYFSDTDLSGVSVSMTAESASDQSSATTPVTVTAVMNDTKGQWARLTGRQVRFGYSKGWVSKQVGAATEADGGTSYTFTDLPEGAVTLWAKFTGILPDLAETDFTAEAKAFILPEVSCSTSETSGFTAPTNRQYVTTQTDSPLYLEAISSSKLVSGAVLTWQIYDNGADEWVSLPHSSYPDLTVNKDGILKLEDVRSGIYRSCVLYNGQHWYSPSLTVSGKDKTTGQSIYALYTGSESELYYDGSSFTNYSVDVSRKTDGYWGTTWQAFAIVKQGNVPTQAWTNLWGKYGKTKYYDRTNDYYLIPLSDVQYTTVDGAPNTSVKVTEITTEMKTMFYRSGNLAEGPYKLTPVVKIWSTTDTTATPAYTIEGKTDFGINLGSIATGVSVMANGEEAASADNFEKVNAKTNQVWYTKKGGHGSYTMTNKQTVLLSVKPNGTFPHIKRAYQFSSSDTSILTVDSDGWVSAHRPGKATVEVWYTAYTGDVWHRYVTYVDITVPIAELKMSEPVWENYIGGYYKDIKLNISQVRSYNGEWVDNTDDKYATSKAIALYNYATGTQIWADFNTRTVAYNDSYTVKFAVKASNGYILPLADVAYYDENGDPKYYNYKDYYCADDMSLRTNKLGSDSMNTARANGYATLTSDAYTYYEGWTGADYSAPAIGVVCEIPCIKDPDATYIKKVSVTTAMPKEGDLRCAVMPSDDVVGTDKYNEVNMLGAQVTTMMTMTNTKDGGALLGVRGTASKLQKLTGSGISYEPLATTEQSANNYFIEYYTALGDSSSYLIDKTKLQTAKYEAGTYVNQIEIWSAVDAEDGNKYYFDPDVELIVNGYKVQLVKADGTTGGYHTTYLEAAYYYAVDGNPAFVAGTVSGLPAPTAGTSSDYSNLAINGTRSDNSSSSDALTFSKLIWFIDADGDKQPDDNEIARMNEDGEYQNLDSNGGFLGGKQYSVYIELAAEEGSRIDSASFQLKLNVSGKDVTLNTAGSSGTYTFPATEIVGYEVSGQVVSFLNGTDTVTVQLIEQGHTEVAYETIVSGGTQSGNKYTAAYSFSQVLAGTYTMKVSKANHVTREYTVTIGAAAVTQDVQIHLLGDVVADGIIDAKDILKLRKHVANPSANPLSDYELMVVDVVADEVVDAKDVLKLRKYVTNPTANPLS